MIVLHALALHCLIEKGQFTLKRPALIDPHGCKTLTLRRNYIEIAQGEHGSPDKWALAFTDGSIAKPIFIGHLNWDSNVITFLRPNGSLPPGYKKGGGCELGWTYTFRDDGDNHSVWCEPPKKRDA